MKSRPASSAVRVSIVAATLISACRQAPRPPAPALLCSDAAPLPASAKRTLDSLRLDASGGRMAIERKARLALAVPGGFAGAYLENLKLVVLLTDTTQRTAALQALDSLLPKIYPTRSFSILDAKTFPARWNFAQLYAWYVYLTSRVSGNDAPVVSLDERGNLISVGARDSTALRRVIARVNTLDVPCRLVHVEVSGAVVVNSAKRDGRT